jgi:hypothetical protein
MLFLNRRKECFDSRCGPIGFTLENLPPFEDRIAGWDALPQGSRSGSLQIAQLEHQIQQMNDLRDQLRAVLEKWDGLLNTLENERANRWKNLLLVRPGNRRLCRATFMPRSPGRLW